jgi:hypothetical protein
MLELHERSQQQHEAIHPARAVMGTVATAHELDQRPNDAMGWIAQPNNEFYLPGRKLISNLPPMAWSVIHEQAGVSTCVIRATAVDELEAGSYHFFGYDGQQFIEVKRLGDNVFVAGHRSRDRVNAPRLDALGTTDPIGRSKIIMPIHGAGYIEPMADQLDRLAPNIDPKQRLLLDYLGYYADDKGRYWYPSPQTLAATAKRLGLPLAFISTFNKEGAIPARDYVQAFADGKFPIGIADLYHYAHDTTNDHLPGVIAGGVPMMEALRPIAQAMLDQNREFSFGFFDSITTNVTYLLNAITNSPADALSNLAHMEDEIQSKQWGLGLSITPGAVTNAILEGITNLSSTLNLDEHFRVNLAELKRGFKPVDTSEMKRQQLADMTVAAEDEAELLG